MADTYSDIALDHFKNPRNVGEMKDASVVGKAENPASGASLELYLRFAGQGRMIERATFKAHGCAATIAAGSVVTELLPGRTLADGVVSRDELAEALGGLPPARKHAYRLVTDAIHSAVAHRGRSMSETT